VLAAYIGLLLAASDPPASDVPANNDIVVIGERMKKIRVATEIDKTGAQKCIVRRSSGDPALDQAFCGAVLTCARTETKIDGMNACMSRELDAVRAQFTAPKKAPER